MKKTAALTLVLGSCLWPAVSALGQESATPIPSPSPAIDAVAAASPAPAPDCRARPFDPSEKETLLRLAWRTLVGHLTGEPLRDADLEAFTLTPCLLAPRGLFVTLHKGDQVRGLQGEIETTRPLYQQVIVFVRRAATRDARFPPHTERDLGSLSIELSIIGERRPVDGPAALHLDTEGVFLEKWGRRALFLPGIAARQGWTPERTLDELCAQASLPKGAWQEGARLEAFGVENVSGGPPESAAPAPAPAGAAPPVTSPPAPAASVTPTPAPPGT